MGPAGLKKALLAKPDQFVTTLTEKLLIYALGRGAEYYDAPTVRAIVRAAGASDYRFSSLILGSRRQRAVSNEDGKTAISYQLSAIGYQLSACALRAER